MTTVFTLPFARIKGVQSKFRLRSASVSGTSPFTGTRSVYGPNVQLWAAEISTAQMKREDWQWMSAFFDRAAGMAGLIRMGDPWRRRPLRDTLVTPTSEPFSDDTTFSDGTGWTEGPLPPSVTAAAAAAAGESSLVLSGLPASLAPALHAGDLFEIRPNGNPAEFGALYEAVNNAPTDADGRTRVTFRPELYAGVAAGDTIVLRDAMTVFRPLSDDEGIVERHLTSIGSLGFSLVEERP